tara:strand:+ start:199 stop:501 length:303 start_codon:yes stop_codon:yes gene_type:complete
MPISIMRARSNNSGGAVAVGTINFDPQAAFIDYKTEETELAIILDEVFTEGVVAALSSKEIDGVEYDFVEEEVDVTDSRFIDGLDTFLSKNSVYWIRITL